MIQLIPFLSKLLAGGAGAVGGAAQGVGDLLMAGGEMAGGALQALGKMGGLEDLVPGGAGKTAGAGGSALVPGTGVQGVPVQGGGGTTPPTSALMPELRGLAPDPYAAAVGPGVNQMFGGAGRSVPTSPYGGGGVTPSPILPPGASGERHGLMKSYMNTMGKVNEAMEATPILGHLLRATPAEMQEREIPGKLAIAQAKADSDMYEEMQKQIAANARTDATNQTRREVGEDKNRTLQGIGEKRDETTRASIAQRDEASKRATMLKLTENWNKLSDEQKEMARGMAEDIGYPIPEEADDGGSWVPEWVKGVKDWVSGKMKGKGKVKSDPLGLFN